MFVKIRFDCFERRRRIQRQASAASRGANRAQGLRDIMFRFRFDVDGDGIRARFEEARHVMIGMLDHEMDVEWKICVLSNGRDDSGPERNIIDEVAVHDVEMEPIGAGFLGTVDLGFETGEVRGEDGRSDEDLGRGHDGKGREGKRPTSNPPPQGYGGQASNVQRSIEEGENAV